jgi:sulfur-carrier protein
MARILFFGRLRDLAGAGACEAPAGCATLVQLRAQLAAGNPALGEALAGPSVRAAIDRVIAPADASIVGAQEIAFMPPLSGG